MIRPVSLAILLVIAVAGCVEEPPLPPPAPSPLGIGESREVELYAIRFDVSDVEEVITRQRIAELPAETRENLWLFNLDLLGGSGSARLIDNALSQIRAMDSEDPSLPEQERNLVRLLQMTPDTADLSGTALEKLLDLAPHVGFASSEVLADALGVLPDEPFLPDSALAQALVHGIISSHPRARVRRGSPTPSHPDGWIPVPEGMLPVTLEDVASNFKSFGERFGPVSMGPVYHPGFLVGATVADTLQPDFRIIVRASTNALPFKGVDLTSTAVGSVSAVSAEGAGLFDFTDPSWLRVEGLKENISVQSMTFQMVETPSFIPRGTSPLPVPLGNSPVWTAPVWSIERVVADAGWLAFGDRAFSQQWYLGNPDTPMFQVNIDAGWFELVTLGNVGTPPPPLYLWDLMLEVAQLRLHDHAGGSPLAEGTAHVQFTLRDVAIGVPHSTIVDAIQRNLEQDPAFLVSTAGKLLDQTHGSVDFYYYRPRAGGPPELDGDWLFFVAPTDIDTDAEGNPTRDYAAYTHPGFFSDSQLTHQRGALVPVDGDTSHLKVRVEPGDTLFCADDEGAVFRVEILPKPSQARIKLRVTRDK